jgi:hypothetical protein
MLRTAVQAPRVNATCERHVSTLCRELPDRVLILSEAHLHTVLTEYQRCSYNTARPHQGRSQRVPTTNLTLPGATMTDFDSETDPPKPVPGGPIKECARAAWRPEDLQVTCRTLFSSGTGCQAALRCTNIHVQERPPGGRRGPSPPRHPISPSRTGGSVLGGYLTLRAVRAHRVGDPLLRRDLGCVTLRSPLWAATSRGCREAAGWPDKRWRHWRWWCHAGVG